MAYFPKPGSNPDVNDKPRNLTQDEIKRVLEATPEFHTPDSSTRLRAKKDYEAWLTKHLETLKLAPSQLNIMIETFVNRFYKAIIAYGTRIGVIAPESIIAGTMQANFNTFKTAGSISTVGNCIDIIREILFNTNRKYPLSMVVFKNKNYSFDNVFNMTRDFIGFKVSRFIKDRNIITHNEFREKWWVNDFELLLGSSTIPESETVLELVINYTDMYVYNIKIEEIVKAISRLSTHITVAYPPVSYGDENAHYIYVIPDNKKIQHILEEAKLITTRTSNKKKDRLILLEQIFLIDHVLASQENNYICGIPEITNFYPITSRVWDQVQSEVYSEGEWTITLKKDSMKLLGISPYNLFRLCELAYLDVEAIGHNHINVVCGTSLRNNLNREIKSLNSKYNKAYKIYSSKVDEKVNENPLNSLHNDIERLYLENPVVYPTLVNDSVSNKIKDLQERFYESIGSNLIEENETLKDISNQIFDIRRKIDFPENDSGEVKIQNKKTLKKLQTLYYDKIKDVIDIDYIKNQEEELNNIKTKIASITSMVEAIPKIKPSEIINYYISNQVEVRRNREKDFIKKGKRITYMKRSEIELASEYIRGECWGKDYQSLLYNPKVDPRFSYTNCPKEILYYLGIEATRTFMYKELVDAIGGSESSIDQRYFDFVVDCMTQKGVIQGLNSSSADRMSGGWLDNVFFRNPIQHLNVESNKGSVQSTSTALVGSITGAGSGGVDMVRTIYPADQENEYLEILSRDSYFTTNEMLTDQNNGEKYYEGNEGYSVTRGPENIADITRSEDINQFFFLQPDEAEVEETEVEEAGGKFQAPAFLSKFLEKSKTIENEWEGGDEFYENEELSSVDVDMEALEKLFM